MTDEGKKQPKRIVQNRSINSEYKHGASGGGVPAPYPHSSNTLAYSFKFENYRKI